VIAPGDLVDGRYAVGEPLGRGGTGEVFRALDTRAASAVALKVLTSTVPGSDRRFRSEADLLRRLEHPGIVALRSAGVHEGVPYLVLGLARGPSLADELHRGRLGVDRALDVGAQLADALGHAHDRGVTHRDVKPSNILFDGERRVRLADFGIARLTDGPALTTTGQVVGTAPYLAPEQLSGEVVGPPADVYALGLVLAECVSGRPCFSGNGIAVAVSRLHRAPALPDDVPRWLHEALGMMTARAPAHRPPADAVAATLRSHDVGPVAAATAQHAVGLAPVVDTAGVPEATEVMAGADRRPVARRQRGGAPMQRSVGAMTAVVVALVLVCLGVLSTRDGGPPDEPPAEAVTTTVPLTTATTPPPTTPPPTTSPPPTTAPAESAADGGSQDGADGGPGSGNGDAHGNGNAHGRGNGGDDGAGRGKGNGP
jgi:hypothetical protein